MDGDNSKYMLKSYNVSNNQKALYTLLYSTKKSKQSSDFVAKPIKKSLAFSSENEHMWRRSYSRQESKLFKKIDSENRYIHKSILKSLLTLWPFTYPTYFTLSSTVVSCIYDPLGFEIW